MLRIHFTAGDLARTTLVNHLDPLWETLLSLHMLQMSDGTHHFAQWRRRTRRRLSPDTLGPLTVLAPPIGYSADFLTPPAGSAVFEEALEQMLSVPRRRIIADLSHLAVSRSARPWVHELADAQPESMRQLGQLVRTFYGVAVAPYGPSMKTAFVIDQKRRLAEVTAGGVEAMLEGIHPAARWRDQVLEISAFPTDSDLWLDGRGLRLQPSYFCWKAPTKLFNDDLAPVLVYPIDHTVQPLQATGTSTDQRQSLDNLLGHTRAAVLALTTSSRTTTELATAAHITLATASYHASALRSAGLIESHRHGKTVLHVATALGRGLLEGRDIHPAADN
jgi:DNA-binding transcriptional ArsR family regulator